jgi:predicted AAA+ superfamily ATPase
MLLRLACCVAFSTGVLASGDARANCAGTVSQLMSKDTEKLSTRYQRVTKQMGKARSAKLVAEGCRIARALEPKLADQIAALKQSGCTKDPEVGSMVSDIVRGHEDDLASIRKSTRSDCQ